MKIIKVKEKIPPTNHPIFFPFINNYKIKLIKFIIIKLLLLNTYNKIINTYNKIINTYQFIFNLLIFSLISLSSYSFYFCSYFLTNLAYFFLL